MKEYAALEKFFRNKKILITGHSGFKGSWLSQMLLNMGSDIIGYSLSPNTEPNLFSILELENKVTNNFCDVRDYKAVLLTLKKERPEIILHLAAQPLVRESYDDPLYTYETNVMGTANLLQASKEVGCAKSIVIITTDKVYEDKEPAGSYKESDELGGHDPYSTSKACAELVTRSYIRSFFNPKNYGSRHNTLVASTRSGNVIGGGDWSKDRLVPDIARAFYEKNESVEIRNPSAIRPWQHVLEPLLGYLLLTQGLYDGRKDFSGAWNFAPEEKSFITVEELVKKAVKATGKGRYSLKPDAEKHETEILRLDATKARTNLGWKPMLSIDECINWTFEWYKSYYEGSDTVGLTNQHINSFMRRISEAEA